MIFVWDEISCEVRPLREDGSNALDQPACVDRIGEVPQLIEDGHWADWQVDHVIDLPDGTRIVIESDDRAHTAVLVTTPQ
jgi:hypothetical protein